MDIWFERCNNSSQGWNKKRKAFLSLSWSFKDGKNLFPGKQKISPREKKTSVGSEEQRRWNSCAFSFFFQTSLLLSVNLEIELGLTSSGSCQWTQLNSSPEAGWAPQDLQTTDEDASERTSIIFASLCFRPSLWWAQSQTFSHYGTSSLFVASLCWFGLWSWNTARSSRQHKSHSQASL